MSNRVRSVLVKSLMLSTFVAAVGVAGCNRGSGLRTSSVLQGVFVRTGSMTTAGENHSATLLPRGKVLIVGETDVTDVNFTTLASAELYDPAAGTSWRTP